MINFVYILIDIVIQGSYCGWIEHADEERRARKKELMEEQIFCPTKATFVWWMWVEGRGGWIVWI